MQTLNDLLTEALTYNWAHYLNIQHGRAKKDINFDLTCSLKHLSAHERLKTCENRFNGKNKFPLSGLVVQVHDGKNC